MLNKLLPLFLRLRRIILIQFCDERTIVKYYRREAGVDIGNNCRIIGKRVHMFGGEPYLVKIGNNVTITDDVKFITHDGGVGMFRNEYPDLNVFGKIVVNDNCFIGVNSILLPNINIGPNSVVGAGSVVTRDVPPDTVVAGVPARVIMSIDEYKKKALSDGLIVDSSDPVVKKEVIQKHFTDRANNKI